MAVCRRRIRRSRRSYVSVTSVLWSAVVTSPAAVDNHATWPRTIKIIRKIVWKICHRPLYWSRQSNRYDVCVSSSMISELNDLCGTAPGKLLWVDALFSPPLPVQLTNMTSSTKPEVLSVSQRRQKKTEPRRQIACVRNLMKLRHEISEIRDRQSDTPTDKRTCTPIAMLGSSTGVKGKLCHTRWKIVGRVLISIP